MLKLKSLMKHTTRKVKTKYEFLIKILVLMEKQKDQKLKYTKQLDNIQRYLYDKKNTLTKCMPRLIFFISIERQVFWQTKDKCNFIMPLLLTIAVIVVVEVTE